MALKTLKVVFKGEDWTFTKKYLVYEDVALDESSDQVIKCIQDAKECLNLTPDDAEVKGSLVIR